MDVTTKAITLTADDYGEYDGLLRLYSLSFGKITVRAKGIRRGKAKLKFAREPFCFGQFELSNTHGYYVLKTCQQLESFPSLQLDITRYYAASVVTECLYSLERENQPNARLFVQTLKCLGILESGAEPKIAALKFLLEYLALSGYKLQTDLCSVCGEKTDSVYIDIFRGGIACEKCRTEQSMFVDKACKAVLQTVDGMPTEKISGLTAPASKVNECLRLLSFYINNCLGKVGSITQLTRLPE